MTISIQPVTSIEECRLVERLSGKIWESPDRDVPPDHLLWTIAKETGIVLLARTEAGEPIGFGYAFLARTGDGHLKYASHQVGVVSAYQSHGVGYQIKLAQRQIALARGVDLMTWTFDPLQGRNAYLNLHKLGAVCNTYLPNLYGFMRDELNQGLPSDRFRVDWWLGSAWVADRLAARPLPKREQAPILNPATDISPGLVTPADAVVSPTGEFCRVEMPANITQIKRHKTELAEQWRRQIQTIFESLFEAGYTVIDLVREQDRNYYLLQKAWQPDLDNAQ